ncbi:hypothetical protein E2C01_102716 [Portunus trituberculatus]|uniref:Uncharacterized protein n=1 Tax=Portunus trituberculatus TaxID=210409 RepID=A0A5B7KPS2_PORTR|nr:hypothetical protein [Portunus trituberculatus]
MGVGRVTLRTRCATSPPSRTSIRQVLTYFFSIFLSVPTLRRHVRSEFMWRMCE